MQECRNALADRSDLLEQTGCAGSVVETEFAEALEERGVRDAERAGGRGAMAVAVLQDAGHVGALDRFE